ncbi:Protein of unknown function [Pyronema omphalodes CBS 100304]|uniref:Uncharacterized protein n=1 Tax=Pyronema omphalodes (strain CBS 100304) TaxID=1076935 RepID=U4LY51_PYROM|nr:Protein of unknown function [Pyronema omphalodes CBS 100304]
MLLPVCIDCYTPSQLSVPRLDTEFYTRTLFWQNYKLQGYERDLASMSNIKSQSR